MNKKNQKNNKNKIFDDQAVINKLLVPNTGIIYRKIDKKFNIQVQDKYLKTSWYFL